MKLKHPLLALALTLPLAGASAQTTQKVTVTAGMLSASSVYADYTPIRAFDGVMSQNTGWCAAGGVRQAWLAVDFGTPRHIAYVQVFPDRYIAGDTAYGYLDRFRVEIPSNDTWQAVTPLIATPQEQWYSADVNFATAQLRFWCESDGNGPQVKEIEIYEFAPPPPVTFTTNTFAVGDEDSGPDCVAFADVNGDGRLDLISANYGFRWALPGEPGGWNTTLTVLTNNRSGAFGSNASLTIGRGPTAVVAADVNGDGRPDLISANETDNSLTVLTNNGNGGFGFKATLPVGSQPHGLVATDVNGDLALDLACVNAGANSVSVLLNQGSGVFASLATLPVGNQPVFIAASDVNGDGQPDLITANKADDSLTVLTNNGGGGFGFNATLPVGHFPNAISAADLNGDARVDLVSVNWGAATMTVLTNNGSGGFGFNATLGVGNYPSTVAAADFNGDGAADLICASTEANSLRVFTNNGSGVFGHDTTVVVGRIPNVFAADLNSDGRMDLACPSFRDGTVTVLLNTTAFAPANSRPTLTIERQANSVRLAWPAASPGWSLQQKPDVNAANWLPSGHDGFGIADDGLNKSLTLPASHASRFFRLLHP